MRPAVCQDSREMQESLYNVLLTCGVSWRGPGGARVIARSSHDSLRLDHQKHTAKRPPGACQPDRQVQQRVTRPSRPGRGAGVPALRALGASTACGSRKAGPIDLRFAGRTRPSWVVVSNTAAPKDNAPTVEISLQAVVKSGHAVKNSRDRVDATGWALAWFALSGEPCGSWTLHRSKVRVTLRSVAPTVRIVAA